MVATARPHVARLHTRYGALPLLACFTIACGPQLQCVPEPLKAPFRVYVEQKVEGNPTTEGRQRRTTAASGQGQNRHERVVQELAGMLTAARQRVVVADRAAQAKVAVPDHIIGVEIDIGE